MPKQFYIAERYNPQLGVYYIASGQMSKAASKRAGKSIYGTNTMLAFESEEDYNQRLEELKAKGEKVQ